ncbi:unnamed protein product [Medioppia subpectinata]|uniref:G2/mitotic-specific cyclin-B3 n=1 Tax=Medioppia subpectinata TaxID=1979941 RepID=A0A7R9KKH8_9ACAR|nr:unnamed protein product [Medioppia subpectinata]CAG2104075.1 unnamed protein product [Medioppia subpectinata]
MSKRVLTNISNVNNNNGLNGNKAVKRTLGLSHTNPLQKKNKVLLNDENVVEEDTACHKKTDPTLSIERKVKAISIVTCFSSAEMMSKRVLTNISNVNNNNGLNGNKAVKRTLGLSHTNPLQKKNKVLLNDENVVEEDTACHKKTDPTLSIERKVKAISIGSKTKTEEEVDIKTESEVSELSDDSFDGNDTIDFADPTTYYSAPKDMPSTVVDYDKSQLQNIDSEPHYASDIFRHYTERELKCKTKKYMESQPELNKAMRTVLIDWMVEIQESFELNHETLYLAVKLIDQYLMREPISKAQFQLIGATTLLIAAKFDERIPPAIEDFIYICDDAYTRRDVILMEMKILRALEFDLCFPISYRFLRRFARTAKQSMETLTLARFVLEMSLLEYEIIEEADSRVAAAALLLALRMMGEHNWTETLEYYTGYKESELTILMYRLNEILLTQTKAKTIRNKYSHSIFFSVTKYAPLPRIKHQNSS